MARDPEKQSLYDKVYTASENENTERVLTRLRRELENLSKDPWVGEKRLESSLAFIHILEGRFGITTENRI